MDRMATFTRTDFEIVLRFLADIRDVLQREPDSAVYFADMLLNECQAAREALRRIDDSVN